MSGDDVKAQLTELQRSVNVIGGEVQDIREEQARSAASHKLLHQEHNRLVSRLDKHERKLDVHLNDYKRQQEQNELIHTHMTGATLELREEVKEFRADFKSHADNEEKDRREVIKAQRQTILWVVGTGITLFLGLAGLLLSALTS